jgi:hypothetical protein
MRFESLMTRENGTEITIVSHFSACPINGDQTNTFVLKRDSVGNSNVLSNVPAQGYKMMPRSEYMKRGKSPMFQNITIPELMKHTQMYRNALKNHYGDNLNPHNPYH